MGNLMLLWNISIERDAQVIQKRLLNNFHIQKQHKNREGNFPGSFPGYILKLFGYCFIDFEHAQFECQNEKFS